MTLCLAWKSGNNIHFASDSRLSMNSDCSSFIDFGIKIFSIPVKIFSPTNFETQQQTLDYDYKIGLCFAGSSTNSYIIKEAIYEVLQRLQYTHYTDFSMNGIAKLISKFHEHTSQKVCSVLREKGLAGFFLTGFCPKDKLLKTYKFELDLSDFPIKSTFKQILVDNWIECLGSGKDEAEKYIKKLQNLSPIKLLRNIINSERVPSVGGAIQYGDFDDENNFTIKGVDDYEINNNNLIRRKLLLRGTQLYENDIVLDFDDFHISYTFIQPFEKEINDWMRDKYGEKF
ncbi:hypothetical protein C8N47_13116 [Mangrovibacterium marinum]|uniref:Uncharacterized protein n=1 Tax=Mangrovibacterium marinum TaxID=1639118 RepID=A0A2T5BX76_9BACT|nr:hypothetical protein [Mangrovibacterium marinum]PTN04481.1 hypothetical protein C8N47_13116 [Mangrovibacterium marinum]